MMQFRNSMSCTKLICCILIFGLVNLHAASAKDIILTVAAPNHIHRARALFESVARYSPNAQPALCLYGDPTEATAMLDADGVSVIEVEDLGIERLHQWTFSLDAADGSKFIKPSCIKYAMEKLGADRVVYFDSDILLFDSIDLVWDRLRSSAVVTTPNDLGLKASYKSTEARFNLAFLGMQNTPQTVEFLTWWQKMLYKEAWSKTESVVQSAWSDKLMSTFGDDASVLMEQHYRASFWALGNVVMKDSVPMSENKPMAYFHFSGYDHENPDVLTRDTTHPGRTFQTFPQLRPMYELYRANLQKYDARSPEEYRPPYIRFDNGIYIPGQVENNVYRKWYAGLPDEARNNFGNPFAVSLARNVKTAKKNLFDELFANSCGDKGEYIPRMMAIPYEASPELRNRFPNVCGKQGAAKYFDWFVGPDGQREYNLDQQLVKWLISRRTLFNTAKVPKDYGVSMVGFFGAILGLGESASLMGEAVLSTTIPTTLASPKRLGGVAYVELDQIGMNQVPNATKPSGFNLMFVQPDRVERAMVDPQTKHLFQPTPSGRRSMNIALWFWELSVFPTNPFPSCRYDACDKIFENIDEIWTSTQFIDETITAASPVPVYHIDHPFKLNPTLRPGMSPVRKQLGIGKRFLFFFNFDYNSMVIRKNPESIIEAYLQAFGPQHEDTALIIKTLSYPQPNNARLVERALHWTRLQRNVNSITKNVHFMSVDLSYMELDYLMADIDCFISLHRSEGVGLGMLKAMALGKPVIGTAYSGNVDFLTEDYAYPVNYKLIDVSPKAFLYGDVVGAKWADANVTHAAQRMREIYDNREASSAKGARAAQYVTARYSAKTVGRLIEQRVRYLAQLVGGNS